MDNRVGVIVGTATSGDGSVTDTTLATLATDASDDNSNPTILVKDVSSGDQQIIERLDTIIALLQAMLS